MKAIKASDFINSIGVCTHIPYTDGLYVNLSQDIADLKYLGIFNVRDGLSDGQFGSAPLSNYIEMAQHGVKFTIVSGAGGTLTASDIQNTIDLAVRVNIAVPGSIVAIEGLNEINNAPVTYNGVSGLQGAENYQADLYRMVHSNPSLQGVKVDYFTGYDLFHSSGSDPSQTPGLADFDTQHPYPQNGSAPAPWISRTNTLPNEPNPVGPAVYTETGYSTNTVSQSVQSKYSLDLIMDSVQQGISKVYLYQLLDAYKPGSPQGDDGFGLFDPDGNAKPLATALHNLTRILDDSTQSTQSSYQTDLNYTLSGLPATANSLLLQKNSGAFDIVVWDEPKIWNSENSTEIQAHKNTASVILPYTYSTIEIFDPTISTSPVQILHDTNHINIGVSDHPVIIQIEPELSHGSIRFTDVANHHYNTDPIKTSNQSSSPTLTGLDQTITQSIGSNDVDTVYTPVWGDVKVLNIHDTNGVSYATNGFMETDINLANATAASLLIIQAKRGIISLTQGNYDVIVNSYSDSPDQPDQHLNNFVFNVGSGNSSVHVNGYHDYTNAIFNAGSGTDRFIFDSSEKRSNAHSTVHFNGSTGTSIVHSNADENFIVFGQGKTDVWGGNQADHYFYHASSGVATIENFSSTTSTLSIDSALKSSLSVQSTNGDTHLHFSGVDHDILLHAISNFDASHIVWV